jgi:hypothetical protein
MNDLAGSFASGSGPLAVWPFASPSLLWWGLAAAIPILIHLLSRRKYRETSWAAMHFLLAALRKQARRIRLEQLLLLAMRTAILLLLALALAEPLIRGAAPDDPAGARGGRTHWVLIFDASYSMDYREVTALR